MKDEMQTLQQSSVTATMHLPMDIPQLLVNNTVDLNEPFEVLSNQKLVQLQEVQQLVLKFTSQLLEGCGDSGCTAPTCYTYRSRIAHKPLRRLTSISVRAAAIYLANLDRPQAQLCKVMATAEPSSVEEIEQASEKDPKSFIQHLFDTVSIRTFLSDSTTTFANPRAGLKSLSHVSFEITSALASMVHYDAAHRVFQEHTCLAYIKQSCFCVFSSHTRLEESFRDKNWQLGQYVKVLLDAKQFESALLWAVAWRHIPLTHLNPVLMDSALRWWSSKVGGGFLINCLNTILEGTGIPLSEVTASAHTIMICVHALSIIPAPPLLLEQYRRITGAPKHSHCDLDHDLAWEAAFRLATNLVLRITQLRFVKSAWDVLSMILNQLYRVSAVKVALSEWIQCVIMTEWDGRATVQNNSIVANALLLLDWLRYEPVPQTLHLFHEAFSIRPFMSGILEPMQLALEYFGPSQDHASLLRYPWMYSRTAQVHNFRAICLTRMAKAVDEANLYSRLIASNLGSTAHSLTKVIQPACSKHLLLLLGRSHLLDDALIQLWRREKRELIRPLRVRIDNEGEEGVDQGGVSQEFFQLAMREAFRRDYGVFKVDEITHIAWFDPVSLEPLYRYEFLGLLVALAVHNGFTLPITFPLVLYRKLLGQSTAALEDILDGWPELGHSLLKLLDYTGGDVGSDIAASYVFSFEAFGEHIEIDMTKIGNNDKWSPIAAMARSKDHKDEAPLVTNANRQAYVKDYIFWLTDKSIRSQFNAFAKGFYACIPQDILKTLFPTTLQDLVQGQQELDVDALEVVTRYVGYSIQSRVIKDFWQVVRGYPPERKRQLLEFVTASDRVPISGAAGMEFVVQRNGGDDERLPTSATCTRTLLLPAYSDEGKLKEKLGIALDNAIGFGLQ